MTKKYRIVITKNNRESRTKLNRNNIRAETYQVCDQSSMLIEIPLLELELPPPAAAWRITRKEKENKGYQIKFHLHKTHLIALNRQKVWK